MSLHVDEQFLAAVAAALGETIDLVHRRGFHPERMTHDHDLRTGRSASRPADNDLVDFADFGLDWDGADEVRACRRPRRMIRRRRNHSAA